MQIRSFGGSGEPVWVNALLLSARDCLGPDPRRALGPAATPAASTGRTRDRTRPMLQKCQKVLAMAPSTRQQRFSGGESCLLIRPLVFHPSEQTVEYPTNKPGSRLL